MKLATPIFSLAERRQIVSETAAAERRAQARGVRVLARLRHERRLAEAHALVADLERRLWQRPSTADAAALETARRLLRYLVDEQGPAMLAAAEETARAIEKEDSPSSVAAGATSGRDEHRSNGAAIPTPAARSKP